MGLGSWSAVSLITSHLTDHRSPGLPRVLGWAVHCCCHEKLLVPLVLLASSKFSSFFRLEHSFSLSSLSRKNRPKAGETCTYAVTYVFPSMHQPGGQLDICVLSLGAGGKP